MVDKYGLFIQANKDTGDSAHRSGTAHAIMGLLGYKKESVMDLSFSHLEMSPGIFVRHPEGVQKWHSDPRCFSRDQASRLILAFAVNNRKNKIKFWVKQMVKRFGFHQNDKTYDTGKWKIPDVIGPGEIRNIIRGLDLWYLYPALLFLDMLFIVDLYTRNDWDSGSLFVPDVFFAVKKYPTPFAFFTKFLIKKNKKILKEILNNHDIKNNGCVELQDLFLKLFQS